MAGSHTNLMNDDQWDLFWRRIDARRAAEANGEEDDEQPIWQRPRQQPQPSSGGKGRPKMHRCGTCTACRASDCGRCATIPDAEPRLRRRESIP